MERFAFPVPAGWQLVAPGEFALGEARLTVSDLQPLPENTPRSLLADLWRASGVPPKTEPLRLHLAGWPALVAEQTFGDQTRMIVAIQMIHLGVIARLQGPTPSFAAARAQTLDALGQGTLVWAAPSSFTLQELLEGIER